MELLTLADHEQAAQAHLDAAVWAYFSGGAGDEHTLRHNASAWAEWHLQPRVLQSLRHLSLSCDLLGKRWPSPILAAPMAQQQLAHPDGEAATALACSALGVGMVLSQQTNTPMEHVAPLMLSSSDRGPLWFQLYHRGKRQDTLTLAQQAACAGYEALVLTVDAPVQGVRDRERKHPMRHHQLARPHWVDPAVAPVPAQLLWASPTWEDVAWLRQHSPLPLLLKGITHPNDAARALELGLAGIVVSNHGGRVLDTVPATAHLLPPIANVLQGRCTLLLDGGLRRGSDIFKALALGADAVLVGRPLLWGLSNAGTSGVAHVLKLLLDELWATMALCGTTTVSAIQQSPLKKPAWHSYENDYRLK